jgi:sulfite exporter TauE/SafE
LLGLNINLNPLFVDATVLGVVISSFFIGLVGSIHCIGMCGGLIYVFTKNYYENFVYQIGRLLGYLILLTLALKLKHVFNFAESAKTISVFGITVLVVLFFVQGIKDFIPWKMKSMNIPSLFNLIQNGIPQALKIGPGKSFMPGLLSIFLPCSQLYLVILGAVSLINPLLAYLMIFTFWLGNFPILLFSTTTIKNLLIPLRKTYPILNLVVFWIISFSIFYFKLLPLIRGEEMLC